MWLVDKNSPTRDVASSVGIGIRGVSARYTEEVSLCFAVCLINATTDIASLRSITGIYVDKRNAMQLRFVLKLLTQVIKRPRVVLSPLCFSYSYPLADACQVLDGNTATGGFSTFNNTLRNLMIDIFSEGYSS